MWPSIIITALSSAQRLILPEDGFFPSSVVLETQTHLRRTSSPGVPGSKIPVIIKNLEGFCFVLFCSVLNTMKAIMQLPE